ncbi:hypothetical protein LY76DRAFT_620855 [Colletotrichum caudatum]|nr:hypothetical protein LY76DRAFT_620855 [Colletotrichum caudatum]
MFPSVIPSIERDPSTRSSSPDPSSGSEWPTPSSPAPPHPSLASRAYSHEGTISPVGPRPCQPETPRYVSAPRPLSASPPSSGIPGELPAALPPATPSTPFCVVVVVPPGPRLGRRARGSDLRAGIGGPHRPRCPSCGCARGSVGPYRRGPGSQNQRRLT